MTYIQLNMSVCGFRLMKAGGELENGGGGGIETMRCSKCLSCSLLKYFLSFTLSFSTTTYSPLHACLLPPQAVFFGGGFVYHVSKDNYLCPSDQQTCYMTLTESGCVPAGEGGGGGRAGPYITPASPPIHLACHIDSWEC